MPHKKKRVRRYFQYKCSSYHIHKVFSIRKQYLQILLNVPGGTFSWLVSRGLTFHSTITLLPVRFRRNDSNTIYIYIRAATLCPCPVLSVDIPGTPRMCEHCNLLQSVIYPPTSTPQPTPICGSCVLTSDAIKPHLVCPGCIVYALIHQNTFLQQ